MRIAVIGAGIVGVTTAYELCADGHDVSIFERHGSVAAGDSFANAGLLAPGMQSPWTSRLSAWQLLLPWQRRADAWRMPGFTDGAAWRWAWKARRAWSSHPYRALHALAAFSQQRVHEIARDQRLDWERANGVLVVLRTADQRARIAPGLAMLMKLGVRHELLDRAGCEAVEPGLNPDTPLDGGIYLADAQAGNCRQFANLLRAVLSGPTVRFRYHTEVQKIVAGRQPQIVHRYAPPDAPVLATAHAEARDGDWPATQPMAQAPVSEAFDAVVVCAGSHANALLAPHGLTLPLRSIWGYSVTAPMRVDERHPDLGPRAALVDASSGVALCRIGARLRVAGVQELGGTPAKHSAAALETLYAHLHDWFPGVAKLNQAIPWKGGRSTLPDAAPVIGPSGRDGIWLNLGHAGQGWALACGSARVIADQLAGRPAAIDVDRLGVARFSKH